MSEELYPVAEKRPDLVRTRTGKPLDALTVRAVIDGEVSPADIAISPEALRLQARIARDAGWGRLAENLERAAELADVPEENVLQAYELLRPGRAKGPEELTAMAERLRGLYGAHRTAALIEEAAESYVRRGLFVRRY
jgi:propanediol dehydratase small subunit